MLLHHVDTFIGIVVILLGVSMIVMVITQIISQIFNSRGSSLKKGLSVLLQNVAPGLKDGIDKVVKDKVKALEKKANSVAKAILEHPMLSDSLIGTRPASAIRKGELVQVLDLLKEDPLVGDDVKNITKSIDDFEKQVEIWFNSTMVRVTQHFSAKMRVYTIITAFIVVFFLQLDLFQVYEKISTDAEVRAGLVGSVAAIQQHANSILTPDTTQAAELDTLISRVKGINETLAQANFSLIPEQFFLSCDAGYLPPSLCKEETQEGTPDAQAADSTETEQEGTPDAQAADSTETETSPSTDQPEEPDNAEVEDETLFRISLRWIGTLAMAALVSLGAPFWFNILGQFMSLRTILAGKIDKEDKK